MSDEQTPPELKADYKEIKVIRDSNELVAVVVTTRGDGKYTFGVFREFTTNDGEIKRTPWMYPRHIDAINEALELTRNFMELQARKDKLEAKFNSNKPKQKKPDGR